MRKKLKERPKKGKYQFRLNHPKQWYLLHQIYVHLKAQVTKMLGVMARNQLEQSLEDQ